MIEIVSANPVDDDDGNGNVDEYASAFCTNL